jgi:hypothetical protein
MQTFSEGVHLQHCTLPHKIRLWLKRLILQVPNTSISSSCVLFKHAAKAKINSLRNYCTSPSSNIIAHVITKQGLKLIGCQVANWDQILYLHACDQIFHAKQFRSLKITQVFHSFNFSAV